VARFKLIRLIAAYVCAGR